MPRPLSHPDGRATRLLAATLRPEARPMAGILAILGAAMALRLALPLLLGRFADDALAGRPASALTSLALLYVAAALGSAALDLVVVWWSARVSWRAGNRLREQLAAHALRLEQAWHGRHSPGQLIERIDGDVEAMAVFFAGMAVQIAGNVALIAGMLVVATTIDPVTGMVLTVTAVAGAATLIRLRVAAVGAREAEREVNAQLYGDLEERLGGLEDLRANGAGRYAVHRLHSHSARSWRAARRASLIGDGAYAMAAVVFAVGTAGTLAAGIVLQQRGVITVGAVLTLYRYADMLRRPLEQIAEQLKEFQKAMAGARRAARLLATEPAIADGPDDGRALGTGGLGVDLDHVTFSYSPDGEPALRDVDLHLAPGTHLGLVGRTGSGKTTIGRLIARTWDIGRPSVREVDDASPAAEPASAPGPRAAAVAEVPGGGHAGHPGTGTETGADGAAVASASAPDAAGARVAEAATAGRAGAGTGAVRLGGVDVRDLTTAALRARVAVVTQDVELFRASVRDNLTLFGTRAADDEELHAVMRRVGLGDWLSTLPEGLDTHLDGSQGLSAGEGQLVAFARAFLADPAVVVLDEASSRLDPETEARVADASDALLAGRTAVIIAHRLDTLDRVDEIAVVDAGRIVEHGRRRDLARTPASHYARLRRAAGRGDAAGAIDPVLTPDAALAGEATA
ncbi:MAG TPA: ABC transporter ATP-binding protein [Acidimicrobiales bacterium]|nr:ABC transporter ATP-binding protein [Acidimicrobiales bacterium]